MEQNFVKNKYCGSLVPINNISLFAHRNEYKMEVPASTK